MYWNPQNRASFFHEMIDLRGPMPRFILKNECFPIYLLGNIINVSWNPQNRACFSKSIDLRGHMPRFTLKSECFPIYLLSNMPEMCVVTHQDRVHCFSKMIDLFRVTCLGWLWKMNVFPSILLETPEMCVEGIRTGLIFTRWSIWGHMPRFPLKMNIFLSISLATP